MKTTPTTGGEPIPQAAESLPVVACLLLDQGCRAADDCEDYERVEIWNDENAGEYLRFEVAGRLDRLVRLSDAQAIISTLRQQTQLAEEDADNLRNLVARLAAERDALKAAAGDAEPEPMFYGRWHHGNGNLCCGSMRYFRADFDTNPAPDVREGIFDWVCTTMNAALDRWRDQKRKREAAIDAAMAPAADGEK